MSDRPVKVRLVPCRQRWHREEGFQCMMLGPIHLCHQAMHWVREMFPAGGTFRDFYDRCPHAGWLLYFAGQLGMSAKPDSERGKGLFWMEWDMSADEARALVAYEEIETWLRKVMAGRPEVVDA